MSTKKTATAFAILAVSLLPAHLSQAQAPQGAAPRAGEVTGNDVYLRSGPSANHYQVTKLQAGDRVTVVGEQTLWYEILPPAGTFSLISGDYVDTVDNKVGVINGNNVNVRAGSSLSDHKYQVQMKLHRGAQVTILASNPDGFLRIVPPRGATFWISKDFVALLAPGTAVTRTPVTTSETAPKTTRTPLAATTPKRDDPAGAEATAPPKSTPPPTTTTLATTGVSALSALRPTPARGELERIDQLAQMEMAKPLLQRQFDTVVARYRRIAEQDEDDLAQRYALKRLEQIQYITELIGSVRLMDTLGEKMAETRRTKLEERREMARVEPSVPGGFDAKGKLVTSSIYDSPAGPKRFRLVEETPQGKKTIGWVEIPVGSDIKIDKFIGLMVGVRASSMRMQAGGVNPIPIFVARELVSLEPPSSDKIPTEQQDGDQKGGS